MLSCISLFPGGTWGIVLFSWQWSLLQKKKKILQWFKGVFVIIITGSWLFRFLMTYWLSNTNLESFLPWDVICIFKLYYYCLIYFTTTQRQGCLPLLYEETTPIAPIDKIIIFYYSEHKWSYFALSISEDPEMFKTVFTFGKQSKFQDHASKLSVPSPLQRPQ